MLPAEDVDRDEDRLEEEEDALDREQHAEYLAEASCERRPEKPELEEMTVPVTAPTANVTATAFDHRCASFNASAS